MPSNKWIPLALVLLGATASAQSVGKSIPDKIELKDFAQTEAQEYGDFFGRAVLIEFFAYW